MDLNSIISVHCLRLWPDSILEIIMDRAEL